MKKSLLTLSAAFLCAAAAQAQTEAQLVPVMYYDYFEAMPCNMAKEVSATESAYKAAAFEEATDGVESFTITKLIYTVVDKSSVPTTPTSGAGSVTLYAAPRTDYPSTPLSTAEMTKVFEGAVSFEDVNDGQLAFTLSAPIEMKKGENLVIAFRMDATELASWNWGIGYGETVADRMGRTWTYDVDPANFLNNSGSNLYYPALSIVYTTEGGETPIVENKATVSINEVYSTRTSADEASLEVLYEVTEAENLSALHFVVVDTEGNKLGEEDAKYGGRESSVYIDLSNLGSEDEVEVTVNCYPVWTDGTEGTDAVAEKTATVDAFVDNKFDLTILEANAERVSATEATLDLRYTLDDSNVDYYQFFVLDGNGNTVGKSDNLNPAGRDASQEIQLTGLTADAQDLTIRWFVQYQDFMSDFVTYDQKVPLAAYNGEADGVELVGAENGEAVYFNLQGARVANPENGLYIRVENGKAQKVVVK